MKSSKSTIALVGVTALILGCLIGMTVRDKNPEVLPAVASPDTYPLLARRILVENPNEPIINFIDLRKQVDDYFTTTNINGGLYFEYLPTGTTVRRVAEEKKVGASLIKLPAAMELYKAHELGLLDIDQKIALRPEWLDNAFGELYKQGPGYELTLREAAHIMLRDSDNTALKALAYTMQGKVPASESPFRFADVDYAQNPDFTISIGPRSYSSFLKCLYFSCYLNKDDSQEILSYLAESSSHGRIKEGIDPDVTVAHKIGNHGTDTQNDCGIVYLPKRNYVLCIMIDGTDNEQTDAHFAALSKIVFDYVKNK